VHAEAVEESKIKYRNLVTLEIDHEETLKIAGYRKVYWHLSRTLP